MCSDPSPNQDIIPDALSVQIGRGAGSRTTQTITSAALTMGTTRLDGHNSLSFAYSFWSPYVLILHLVKLVSIAIASPKTHIVL